MRGKISVVWGWEGVPLNFLCLRTCADEDGDTNGPTQSGQVHVGNGSVSLELESWPMVMMLVCCSQLSHPSCVLLGPVCPADTWKTLGVRDRGRRGQRQVHSVCCCGKLGALRTALKAQKHKLTPV